MAQSNRGFQKSKMNKDADERTVANGEYRDALNIQVSASDGSNVGSAQTILGNTLISGNMVPGGSTVVGSIAHNKEDKVYYLVAGPKPTAASWNQKGSWKDYIIEFDIKKESFKYVFVDIYQSNVESNTGVISRDIPVNIGTPSLFDSVRYEMVVQGFDSSGMQIITSDPSSNVEVISTSVTSSTTGIVNIYSTTQDFNSIPTPSGTWLNCKAERVLNFDKDHLITGINIIDGMLFWTDNHTEPKKIDIERSINGTGGGSPLPPLLSYTFPGDSDQFHTRLCITPDKTNPLRVKPRNETEPWYIKEANITVIRKGPVIPPSLEMSEHEDGRAGATYSETDGSPSGISGCPNVGCTSSTTAQNSWSINPPAGPDRIKKAGDTIDQVYVVNPVDWRIGDMILFNQQEDINSAEGFIDHDVRATVTSTPGGASTGPYSFEIQSIDKDAIDQEQKMWNIRMEEKKPMFEMKFVRFAYRYKYEDGEYSTFSPWSQPAFIPGEYDYLPKKAYNLGMTNRLRQLKITNYLLEGHYGIYNDVIEIDLLYKDEVGPQVYVVETLKMTDGWGVDGSPDLWPDKWKDWPVEDTTLRRKRGEYKVTSELISKVVPSNQMLRPWDNVPRKALAQEVTSNRLVYANYMQNFNLTSQYTDNEVKPIINLTLSVKDAPLNDPDLTGEEDSFSVLSLEEQVGNLEGFAKGVKTVRSLRTYQVGVVYGDKYGRETPVLAGKDGAGSLTINVENSSTINKLKAWVITDVPSFAAYYKFYVKETSNKYYNLAMDRWYLAEDGNIWISFASADRNKVDDETNIILKKMHDTHEPVTDLARYKIIAIENSAPKFIKTKVHLYGQVQPSATQLGSASIGFPMEFYNVLHLHTGSTNMTEVEEAWGKDNTAGGGGKGTITDKISSGFIYIRVRTKTVKSNWYQLASMAKSGSYYKMKLVKTFKKDVAFAGGSYANAASDLRVEFSSQFPEDKPEFEGRYFVKIYKDLILMKWLLQSKKKNYRTMAARPFHYFNQRKINQTRSSTGAQASWESSGVNVAGEFDASGGSHRNPCFSTSGVSVTSHGVDSISSCSNHSSTLNNRTFFYGMNSGTHTSGMGGAWFNTGSTIKNVRYWGQSSRHKFFIDGLITRGTESSGNICFPFATGLGSNAACANLFGKHFFNVGNRSDLTHRHGTSTSGKGQRRGRAIEDDGMKIHFGYIHTGGWAWNSAEDESWYNFMTTKGTMFRFSEDKDEVMYVVTGFNTSLDQNATGEGKHHLHSSWSSGNGGGIGMDNAGNNLRRFSIEIEQMEYPGVGLPSYVGGGAGFSGYHPLGGKTSTKIPGVAELGYWGGRPGATSINTSALGGAFDDNKDLQIPTPPDYQNEVVKVNGSAASNLKNDGAGGWEAGISGIQQARKYRMHPAKFHNIEILEEVPDDGDWSSKNPAVWETEPKEDVGMDIYYEASQAMPVNVNAYTNEQLAPIGSLVENDSGSDLPGGPWQLHSWSDTTFTMRLLDGNTPPSFTIQSGDRFRFTRPDGFVSTIIVNTPPGSAPWPATITIANYRLNVRGNTTAAVPSTPNFANSPHNQPVTLSWHNAIAFGNGVESDRIRDDFNANTISNGVKASTVLAIPYHEERRKAGLIHSGIYNSTSGLNSLNQFIAAEKITKDMNPSYGGIQKLHTRDNNIVVMHEDKIMKVLANKDALFNADQSKNVVVSKNFLGSDEPFSTRYGMSTNPESFAVDLTGRVYFTDRTRAAVLRLSNDGITNISDYGMKDWFNDHLNPETNTLLGSFDEKKGLYNLTIDGARQLAVDEVTTINDGDGGDNGVGCGCENGPGTNSSGGAEIISTDGNTLYTPVSTTVSFSENAKGWTSFKSFIPENGISINNEYYTFLDGEMWHHHSNSSRNQFYGDQYDSSIDIIFNDDPSAVKSYSGVNYEGTEARITGDLLDSNYFNLNDKTGWYVDTMATNLQTTNNLEFKEKEGKYFTSIKGNTTTLANLDENEFSVQGIGNFRNISVSGPANPEPGDEGRVTCLTVTPIINCDEVLGCTDPYADNYDASATTDDGSCEYPVACITSHTDDPSNPYPGHDGTLNRPENSHHWHTWVQGGETGGFILTPLATTSSFSTCTTYLEFHFEHPGSNGGGHNYASTMDNDGTNSNIATLTPGVGIPLNLTNTNSISSSGMPTIYVDEFVFGSDCDGTFYFELSNIHNNCTSTFSITTQEPLANDPVSQGDLCQYVGGWTMDPLTSDIWNYDYDFSPMQVSTMSNQIPASINDHTIFTDIAQNGQVSSEGGYGVMNSLPFHSNSAPTALRPRFGSQQGLASWLPEYEMLYISDPANGLQSNDFRTKQWPYFYQGAGNGWRRPVAIQTNPGAMNPGSYLADAYQSIIGTGANGSWRSICAAGQYAGGTNTLSGNIINGWNQDCDHALCGTLAGYYGNYDFSDEMGYGTNQWSTTPGTNTGQGPQNITGNWGAQPYQTTGQGCDTNGQWSGFLLTLYSYEEVIHYVRLLALHCADNEPEFGTGSNHTATRKGVVMEFLKNATLSTPWYGPAYIDPNGHPITASPDPAYSVNTAYGIEGSLRFCFDDAKCGIISDCFLQTVFVNCAAGDGIGNNVGASGPYVAPSYFETHVAPSLCKTNL